MKREFCRNVAMGLALLLLSPVAAPAQQVQRNPIVVHAIHATTPRALRDMTPVPWHNTSKVMPRPGRAPHPHISGVPDALIQSEVLPQVHTTSLLNFDGIIDAQGGSHVPPDTNASVGATQVVETVNVAVAVYDKTTGALILGPVNFQNLFSSLGGECATGNVSDPIVTYDKAAGRWLISILAFNSSNTDDHICVAVSISSDATGGFNVYDFSYGTTFPDYPKLGVWPDAYYLTTNNFSSGSYIGAETCALDRTSMLAGGAANMICFQGGTSDFSLLPADLDGAGAPPAGSPNYQLELASSTTLNLFYFHVDFAVPSNSIVTGPTLLTVKAYTDACATSSTGTCIPQPSPGELLDSLGDRLMYRLAYRNFGDHEALVANHSIKTHGTGGAVSAVRWYEIRNPGSVPVVFQQGTVGGGTNPVSKWMGSIAMDKNGDIVLGYSKSSSALDPSIEYVGRKPTDVAGKMESPKLIIAGTGVQAPDSFNRWGDYSSMAIDPSDDCTFWYTQEYYKTTAAKNWVTRLASFKFTGCV